MAWWLDWRRRRPAALPVEGATATGPA
jgi:hypothetical protein